MARNRQGHSTCVNKYWGWKMPGGDGSRLRRSCLTRLTGATSDHVNWVQDGVVKMPTGQQMIPIELRGGILLRFAKSQILGRKDWHHEAWHHNWGRWERGMNTVWLPSYPLPAHFLQNIFGVATLRPRYERLMIPMSSRWRKALEIITKEPWMSNCTVGIWIRWKQVL